MWIHCEYRPCSCILIAHQLSLSAQLRYFMLKKKSTYQRDSPVFQNAARIIKDGHEKLARIRQKSIE